MSTETTQFDAYHQWLGIKPKDQPPHYYRLLGLEALEEDPNVIENAADRQMAHIRSFQSGKHSDASQRILNEISAAKICLLNKDKKAAYDAQLRTKLTSVPPVAKAKPLAKAAARPAVTDDSSGNLFPGGLKTGGATSSSLRTVKPAAPASKLSLIIGGAIAALLLIGGGVFFCDLVARSAQADCAEHQRSEQVGRYRRTKQDVND